MHNGLSLYGPWWLLILAALAFPLVLYYFLYYLRRRHAPLWLLFPLVIVLAPVGVLAIIIDTVFLLVVVLTLHSTLAGYPPGQMTVGILLEPSAWWVYLLEGAAALLMVAVIVYLIRRS